MDRHKILLPLQLEYVDLIWATLRGHRFEFQLFESAYSSSARILRGSRRQSRTRKTITSSRPPI